MDEAAFKPMCQPHRPKNSTLGPGAACAKVIEAWNCASVSQAFSVTRVRCCSEAKVMTPPTDSSDIDSW